jgi:hypothetical protein
VDDGVDVDFSKMETSETESGKGWISFLRGGWGQQVSLLFVEEHCYYMGMHLSFFAE